MAGSVEIDPQSGFCGGVIRAITTAENYLTEHQGAHLCSLGSIVHNEEELARLESKGLRTINLADLDTMTSAGGEVLLIRAHGEPPQTYVRAAELGFEVVDCTCPVVLQLQKAIREAYAALGGVGKIIIFGKVGHAEVLGLVGQVGGDAVVVENQEMLQAAFERGDVPVDEPVEIFSQTTKSPAEYGEICALVRSRMASEDLVKVHDTICRQVGSRHSGLTEFAKSHDIIIFVAGKSSSNGQVLCNLCRSVNIRTYHIGAVADLKREWFRSDDRVGVCGATSTPKWLLEEVAAHIENFA